MMVRFLNVTIATALLLAAAQMGRAQGIGEFEAHQDIGKNPKAGTASFDAATGSYRVSGGGYDMWFDVDAFHFVWRRLEGDVALEADIEFVGEGVHERRKAALMVRQSLDADAAYADVAVHANGLTALQRRPARGAETDHIEASVSGPTRVRMERRGDRFTMFTGEPGGELTEAASFEVALEGPVYVGLAMCAHEEDVVETAIFSNVKVETEF